MYTAYTPFYTRMHFTYYADRAVTQLQLVPVYRVATVLLSAKRLCDRHSQLHVYTTVTGEPHISLSINIHFLRGPTRISSSANPTDWEGLTHVERASRDSTNT